MLDIIMTDDEILLPTTKNRILPKIGTVEPKSHRFTVYVSR